jgi:hypothetical protein
MLFLLFEDILARLICTTDAVTSICISNDSSGFPDALITVFVYGSRYRLSFAFVLLSLKLSV